MTPERLKSVRSATGSESTFNENCRGDKTVAGTSRRRLRARGNAEATTLSAFFYFIFFFSFLLSEGRKLRPDDGDHF